VKFCIIFVGEYYDCSLVGRY